MAVQNFRARQGTPPPRSRDHEAWEDDAACTRHDPELFYPHPTDVKSRDAAKRVCWLECPVRVECLTKALRDEVSARSRHGVWGGYSESEREHLARTRHKETP